MSGAPFSTTVISGSRHVLHSIGRDVVVSTQAARTRALTGGGGGQLAGYEPLQRLYNAHPSEVVALRWFSDVGGGGGSAHRSVDTGDTVTAWSTMFLSACEGGSVKLYAPVQDDARVSDRRKWVAVATVEAGFGLRDACWAHLPRSAQASSSVTQHAVVLGGDQLAVWSVRHTHVDGAVDTAHAFTEALPDACRGLSRVTTSHDSRFIAGCGPGLAGVALWFRHPRRGAMKCVLLGVDGGAEVAALEWRPVTRPPQSSRATSVAAPSSTLPAVLFGLWSDGQTRLWRESDSTEAFAFDMCASWDASGRNLVVGGVPLQSPPPHLTAAWVCYGELQDRVRGAWDTAQAVAPAGTADRPSSATPTLPAASPVSPSPLPSFRWPSHRHSPVDGTGAPLPASVPSAALGMGLLPSRTRHRDFVVVMVPHGGGSLALLFSVEGCCDVPQQACHIVLQGSAEVPVGLSDAPSLRLFAAAVVRRSGEEGGDASGAAPLSHGLSLSVSNRQWVAAQAAPQPPAGGAPVDLWSMFSGSEAGGAAASHTLRADVSAYLAADALRDQMASDSAPVAIPAATPTDAREAAWADLMPVPVTRAACASLAKPVPTTLTLLFEAGGRRLWQTQLLWQPTAGPARVERVGGHALPLNAAVVGSAFVAAAPDVPDFVAATVWVPAVARTLAPLSGACFPFLPGETTACPVALFVSGEAGVTAVTSYGHVVGVGRSGLQPRVVAASLEPTPLVAVGYADGSVVGHVWSAGAGWSPAWVCAGGALGTTWLALQVVGHRVVCVCGDTPDGCACVDVAVYLCGVSCAPDGRVLTRVWEVAYRVPPDGGDVVTASLLLEHAVGVEGAPLAAAVSLVPNFVLGLLHDSRQGALGFMAATVFPCGRVAAQLVTVAAGGVHAEDLVSEPLFSDRLGAGAAAVCVSNCGFVAVGAGTASGVHTVVVQPAATGGSSATLSKVWDGQVGVPEGASRSQLAMVWTEDSSGLPGLTVAQGCTVTVLGASPASHPGFPRDVQSVAVTPGVIDDMAGPAGARVSLAPVVVDGTVGGAYGWMLLRAYGTPHPVAALQWGPSGKLWAAYGGQAATCHFGQVADFSALTVGGEGGASAAAVGPLPQYHPSALMANLSAGHVGRAQRVLGHVAACIRRAQRVDASRREQVAARKQRLADRLYARLQQRMEGAGVIQEDSDDAGHASTDSDCDVGAVVDSDSEDGEDSVPAPLRVAVPVLPMRVLLSAPKAQPIPAVASKWGDGGGGWGGSSRWGGGGDAAGDAAGEEESKAAPAGGGDGAEDGGGQASPVHAARRASLSHAAFPFSQAVALADFTEESETEVSASYAPAFGSDEADRMASELQSCVLPGLSPSDHLMLMAVASVTHTMYGGSMASSMDDAGSRFILAVKFFGVCRTCLPAHRRPSALSHAAMLWALHSDSQDSVLPLCLKAMPVWSQVRGLGVPLWLRSTAALRGLVERCAKAQYMRSGRNPFACMLLYLSLGMSKLPLVTQLFRSSTHTKVYTFLQKDFTLERWRTAAGKNAFALLGQHRYDVAAAFFLVAGQPARAVKTCLTDLKDPMLALLVARFADEVAAAADAGDMGGMGGGLPGLSHGTFGAFDASAELPLDPSMVAEQAREDVFDSPLFASTSIAKQHVASGAAAPVMPPPPPAPPAPEPVSTTHADLLFDVEGDVVVENPDEGPPGNETLVHMVLTTHFASAAVASHDPWMTSLVLWLLKRPIASVAAVLGAGHSAARDALSALAASSQLRADDTSGAAFDFAAASDPELVRFARFLLEKPQLRAPLVIREVVRKIGAAAAGVATTSGAHVQAAVAALAEAGGVAYARAGLPLLALGELGTAGSRGADVALRGMGTALQVYQLVCQVLAAAATATDTRVAAATQLWHERHWAPVARRLSDGAPVVRDRRGSVVEVESALDAAIAPVCGDTRVCLVDEMASLRHLADRTRGTQVSPPDALPPQLTTADSTSLRAADVDLSEVLFHVTATHSLVFTHLDLACELQQGASGPPAALLDAWSDQVVAGAAEIADGCQFSRRCTHRLGAVCGSLHLGDKDVRLGSCSRLVQLADGVSRVTAAACWFARSADAEWPQDLTDVAHTVMWCLHLVAALNSSDYVALRALCAPLNCRYHTVSPEAARRAIPSRVSTSIRACLRHRSVASLGRRHRPHHTKASPGGVRGAPPGGPKVPRTPPREPPPPSPTAGSLYGCGEAAELSPAAGAALAVAQIDSWLDGYTYAATRFLVAAQAHALLSHALASSRASPTGAGRVAAGLLAQLLAAAYEWQADEFQAVVGLQPPPAVWVAMHVACDTPAVRRAAATPPPEPGSRWGASAPKPRAAQEVDALEGALAGVDVSRRAIVARLLGLGDDEPLVPAAAVVEGEAHTWLYDAHLTTPAVSPATVPRRVVPDSPPQATRRKAVWWQDSVPLFRKRPAQGDGSHGGTLGRRHANAAVMCWHMLGGPGLLWMVGAESRAVQRAKRRKAIGYLPHLPVDRAVTLYGRKNCVVSAMATPRARVRPTMVLATESGLFELDLVGVRTARRQLGVGATGDDPSTWHPVLTPQSHVDVVREVTAVDVARCEASGVVPWDSRMTASRLRGFEGEVDGVLRSHWGASQGVAALRSTTHDTLLATRLDCHPALPYYVSGGGGGGVLLWKEAEAHVVAQFGQGVSGGKAKAVGFASAPDAKDRITRVRFNANGLSLAACGNRGAVWMWQTTRPEEPLEVLPAHSKRASDVAFLNSTTVLAVSGSSPVDGGGGGGGSGGGHSLRVYDICCPPSSWEVASAAAHPDGGTSFCMFYDEHSRALVSGGERGDISVFDLRMQRVRRTITGAHTKAIKTLSLDPLGRYFASGSTDGDVKVWDLPALEHSVTLGGLHPERTLMNHKLADTMIARYGVTEVVLGDDWLYTCGANGKVLAVPKVW